MPHSFPTRRSSDLFLAGDAVHLFLDVDIHVRIMLVVGAHQLVDDAAQPLGGGQDGIIGDPLALVDIVVDSDAQALAEQLFLAAEIIIDRSEEHTSELQSLMRISYAVFCLKK